MVESVGMQQVLQLSSTVEKAQTAQLSQSADIARAFDKELEKQAGIKAEQTQEVEKSEEKSVGDGSQKDTRQFARSADKRGEKEEEEEEEEVMPISEAGVGVNINLRA